jgi:hypothetical protein
MSLYDYWKKHLGESAATAPEFHANKGWFYRFKNRVKLHNIKLTGGAATASKQAALEFMNTLNKF